MLTRRAKAYSSSGLVD